MGLEIESEVGLEIVSEVVCELVYFGCMLYMLMSPRQGGEWFRYIVVLIYLCSSKPVCRQWCLLLCCYFTASTFVFKKQTSLGPCGISFELNSPGEVLCFLSSF